MLDSLGGAIRLDSPSTSIANATHRAMKTGLQRRLSSIKLRAFKGKTEAQQWGQK